MKKIPTLFVRDEKTHLVTPRVTPGCEWVLEGIGVATRKWDGTCCLVRDGKLYKRQEVKPGKVPPDGFERVDFDSVTGKAVGWVAVGNGPEDRWHLEAFGAGGFPDGTYELVGPKINRDPEKWNVHQLVPHGVQRVDCYHRTFEGIQAFLARCWMEGVVFWRTPGVQDCDKAKIKCRDFGIVWPLPF